MYYHLERNMPPMTSDAAMAARAETERQVDNQSAMSSPTTPASGRRFARTTTRHTGTRNSNSGSASAMAVQVVDRLRWWRLQRVREQPLPAHHYVLGANYTNYSAFGTRPLSSAAAHAVRRARALLALQRPGRIASPGGRAGKHPHSSHVDPGPEHDLFAAAEAEGQLQRCSDEARTRSHSSPAVTRHSVRQPTHHDLDDMGGCANELIMSCDEAGDAHATRGQLHADEEEEENVMDNKASAVAGGAQTRERATRPFTAHDLTAHSSKAAQDPAAAMTGHTARVLASQCVSEAAVAAARRVLELYRPRAASAPVSRRRKRRQPQQPQQAMPHEAAPGTMTLPGCRSNDDDQDGNDQEQMGGSPDPRVVVLHHPPRLVLYRKHCAIAEAPRVAGVTASDMANHELMKDQPEVFALGNLPLFDYERRFYGGQMPWGAAAETTNANVRTVVSPHDTARSAALGSPLHGSGATGAMQNNPLGTRAYFAPAATAKTATGQSARRSCATRVRGRLRAASLPALPPCSAELMAHNTTSAGKAAHARAGLATPAEAACAHLFRQVEVLQDVYIFNPFVDCIGTGAFSQVYAALPIFHGRSCLPHTYHISTATAAAAGASHAHTANGVSTTSNSSGVVSPVAIKVISRKAKKRPEAALPSAGNAGEAASRTRRQEGRGAQASGVAATAATGRARSVRTTITTSGGAAAVAAEANNVDNSQHRELVEVEREIAVLRRLHHSGCSTFYEALRTRDEFVIAMKLHPGSLNMRQYLARFGPPAEARAALMLYQLVETVNYLHNSFGLIHRDIKLENLLLSLVDAPLDLIQQTLGSEVGRAGGARPGSAHRTRLTSPGRDEKPETPHQHTASATRTRAASNGPAQGATIIGSPTGFAPALMQPCRRRSSSASSCASTTNMGTSVSTMNVMAGAPYACALGTAPATSAAKLLRITLIDFGLARRTRFASRATRNSHPPAAGTMLSQLAQGQAGNATMPQPSSFGPRRADYAMTCAAAAVGGGGGMNVPQPPSFAITSSAASALHATPTTLALLPPSANAAAARVLPIPTPLPSTANLFTDFYDVEDAEERLSGVSSTDVSASQTSQSSTADTEEEEEDDDDEQASAAMVKEREEGAGRASAERQGSYRTTHAAGRAQANAVSGHGTPAAAALPQPWLVAAAGASSEYEGLPPQLAAQQTPARGTTPQPPPSPQNVSLLRQDESDAEQTRGQGSLLLRPQRSSASQTPSRPAATHGASAMEGSVTSYGAAGSSAAAVVVAHTPQQASSFAANAAAADEDAAAGSRAVVASASKSAAREPSSSPSMVPMTAHHLAATSTNAAAAHASIAMQRSDSLASLGAAATSAEPAPTQRTLLMLQPAEGNANRSHAHSPCIAALAGPSDIPYTHIATGTPSAPGHRTSLSSPAAEPHLTGTSAKSAANTNSNVLAAHTGKERSLSFSASVSFAATTGLPPAVPPPPLPPQATNTTSAASAQPSLQRSCSYAAGTRLTRSAVPVRGARLVTHTATNASSHLQPYAQARSEEVAAMGNHTACMTAAQQPQARAGAAMPSSAPNTTAGGGSNNNNNNVHTNMTSCYNNSYGDDEETTLLLTPCGTEKYMAPEMLGWIISHGWTRRPVTVALAKQLDSYAIGIVAYVLLSGCFPFNATTRATLAQQEKRLPRCNSVHWSGVSGQAIGFVQGLLHPDPHQRLTVKAALQHPFMQEARHWAEKLQLVPHAERAGPASTTATGAAAAAANAVPLSPAPNMSGNPTTFNSICSSNTSVSTGSAQQPSHAQAPTHERPAAMSAAEHTLPIPAPELPRRSVSSLIPRSSTANASPETAAQPSAHPTQTASAHDVSAVPVITLAESCTQRMTSASAAVLSAQGTSTPASRLTSVDHRNQSSCHVLLPPMKRAAGEQAANTAATPAEERKATAAAQITLPAVQTSQAVSAGKEEAGLRRSSVAERLRARSDEDDLFDQLYNNIMSAD